MKSQRVTTKRFVSCDPGYERSGVACWEINETEKTLIRYGECKDNSKNFLDRIDSICTSIAYFSQSYGADFFVIEKPPQTLYGQNGHIKTVAQASKRAQSLFKLFCIFSSASMIHIEKLKIPVYWLEPSQWQASSYARNGKTTKEWSIEMANHAIKNHSDLKQIKYKNQHNIADAIMIGWVFGEKLIKSSLPENQSFTR